MHTSLEVEPGKGQQHSLAVVIRNAVGEAVSNCYQCGKCSAGCPLAEEMDFPPSQILRMIQHENPQLDEKVLRSQSIWLCLTCETCVTRCPKEVDLPRIMEALRSESLRQKKVNRKAKDVLSFHKAFLDSIRHTGRLYEIGLISDYKLRSGHLLQDVLTAPKLFKRGKLRPMPHLIKGRKHVARIFKRAAEKEEKQ